MSRSSGTTTSQAAFTASGCAPTVTASAAGLSPDPVDDPTIEGRTETDYRKAACVTSVARNRASFDCLGELGMEELSMTQWEIAKFAPSAASEDIAAAVTRDVCAIAEGLASKNTQVLIERELAPHVEVTPKGDGEIMGFETKRTAGLMAGAQRWEDRGDGGADLDAARGVGLAGAEAHVAAPRGWTNGLVCGRGRNDILSMRQLQRYTVPAPSTQHPAPIALTAPTGSVGSGSLPQSGSMEIHRLQAELSLHVLDGRAE